MIIKLPTNTQKLVYSYLNLDLGRHKIACPYYQNISKKRDRAVFLGKGLPNEIISETEIVFRSLNIDPNNLEPQSVRLYMTMANIGIDCSGFAARIAESILNEKKLGSLRQNLKPSGNKPSSILRHHLKTSTNLSSNTLSSQINCVEIKNLNDVQPGDFLRVGRKHIATIIEVVRENKVTIKLKYTHSTSDYEEMHGVRIGEIIITNPKKSLIKQEWTETYNKRNWMFEDFSNSKETDRGIRRLKVLTKGS